MSLPFKAVDKFEFDNQIILAVEPNVIENPRQYIGQEIEFGNQKYKIKTPTGFTHKPEVAFEVETCG